MKGYRDRIQKNLERMPLVKAIKKSVAKLDKENAIMKGKQMDLQKKRAAFAPK